MNIYRYDIEGEHIYVAALTKNQADFIIVESDMVEPEDLTEPYMLSESQWDSVSVYDEEPTEWQKFKETCAQAILIFAYIRCCIGEANVLMQYNEIAVWAEHPTKFAEKLKFSTNFKNTERWTNKNKYFGR